MSKINRPYDFERGYDRGWTEAMRAYTNLLQQCIFFLAEADDSTKKKYAKTLAPIAKQVRHNLSPSR